MYIFLEICIDLQNEQLSTKMKNELHKQQVFEEYNCLHNINELVRISIKSYYKHFFIEHNNNIEKVW